MVDPGRLRRLLGDLEGYRDRLAALSELPVADHEVIARSPLATWFRSRHRLASTWPIT